MTNWRQWLKNHFIHLPRAILANWRYGWPSRRLNFIGVTGTDGKTTTTLLIHHLLREAGLAAGYVSTIAAQVGKKQEPTGLHVTSPPAAKLQRWLAAMAREQAGKWVVLEATSHGLDQYRLWGIHFQKAILTNLTHEHLDYHQTMENYFRAKMRLLCHSERLFVYENLGKQFLPAIKKTCRQQKIFLYGLSPKSDWQARNLHLGLGQTSFDLYFRRQKKGHFQSQLTGEFNLHNQIAALAAVLDQHLVSLSQAQAALATFPPPRGRMEIVAREPFLVMIDFAHTPNALEQLLRSLRQVHSGRILVVFGAAGERDREKRPLMGEIAARWADVAVLTSEDPRTEDPQAIIEAIARGCRQGKMRRAKEKDARLVQQGKKKKVFFQIENRQEAINFALRRLARPGDLVVLCGKGHEQSICYGHQEYPWSEHQAVKVALGQQP